MNPRPDKAAAFSLIAFTVLILLTMVLHPAGGNFQYLQKIAPLILVSHSIAILSLPFGAIGFRGLHVRLGTNNFLSTLGFALALLALVAVLIAAGTNGLILPLFVRQFRDASPAVIEGLRPVLAYGRAANAAFDYLYTGSFTLAILCWSIAWLRTGQLPARLGWWGIVVALAAVVLVIIGPSPASLHGLYFFAAGLISWMILAGGALM